MKKQTKNKHIQKLIYITGLIILFSIVFWVCLAAVDTFAARGGNFFQHLTAPSFPRLISRLCATALFFLVLTFFLLKQRRIDTSNAKNETFRHFVEISRDVVIAIDTKGRFTYLNPQFEALTGFNSEELLGKGALEMLSPLSADKARKFFSRGISGRDTPLYEIEFIHKNGTPIPVEINVGSIKNRAGEVTGRLAIARDISERRKMEKALRESEEKFRVLAESTPTAIMMYQDDIWVYANSAAEEMSGYTEEELKKMHFWEIVAPEYRKIVQDRGKRRQSGKNTVTRYEFQIQNKNGKHIWVELAGSTTMLNGTPSGIITVTDISAYKAALEALKKSEEKYRTILENIEDAYFELDLAGNITLYNEKLLELFGYTFNEVENINYKNFTKKESQKKLFETFNTVYRTGVPVNMMETRVVSGKGRSLPLEVSISLIRDEQGKPAGFRGIARDISERKQLQEELSQALKMEAVGTLAGGIAHDFNNLLMAIQGNITMIKRKMPENEEILKRTGNIQQCIDNGSDLTRQLLGFARRGKYSVTPFDINDTIKKTAEMIAQTRKEITVEKKLHDGPLTVEADQSQIEQVLMNMYVNAVQSMPEGGMLKIETDVLNLSEKETTPYKTAAGQFICISITDQGTGMNQETVQRIFEPFFTTREMATSTGLGLASAYGIVRNHDGFITVDSEINRGTTFKIFMPLSGKSVISDKNSKTNSLLCGKQTILLIDDEKIVLNTAKDMLNALGYTVFAVDNGSDALELFKEKHQTIDLVILDMIMPGMNGKEVFKNLKKIDSDVKIILSSGYSQNEAAETIMSLGCAGFLEKPFDLEKLSHIIHETCFA